MHDRDGEHYNCQNLMREGQRKRRLVEQSHYTKNSLRRHRGGEQDSSTGATPRLPGVNRVQTGKYPDRIGHHAMVELNGKRILEQVAPDGAHKPQPLRSRHNGVIDRRPGIEDEARVETGHQRTKINLQQQQNCDNERAGTQPDSASLEARGASCCAVHRIAA